MKGKGKGGGDKGEKQDKDKGSSSSDNKDVVLQFPDIRPVDHVRLCPRYTSVLQRPEHDGIGPEDLDILQTELETLLSACAKRMRQIEAMVQALNSSSDKNGKAESESSSRPVTPSKGYKKGGKVQPEKRSGKGSDDKPSKKFKDSTGKAKDVQKFKGKGQGDMVADSPKPADLPKITKQDIPNRFWAMVEPYCAEISNDDLKVLEEIMRSHEDEADYHKVPTLGKHYSHKWAVEDMVEEQKEDEAAIKLGQIQNKLSAKRNKGGSKPDKRRSAASGSAGKDKDSAEAKELLKRVEDRQTELNNLPPDSDDTGAASPFGPLTQRLVAALIEENIMTPPDEDSDLEKDAAEAACMSPRSLAKQLNIGNTANLERRIKRELEEQGILDADEKPEEDPEDEILNELRRKQNELRVLSQQNIMHTKRLFKLAKEEMARQDMRRKMIAVDAEVMDAYRRIQTARGKKKQPTKKEKDMLMKALKEREGVIKQLEAGGS